MLDRNIHWAPSRAGFSGDEARPRGTSYRPIGAGQVDFQVLLEVPQMEQGRPDRAGTVPEGRAVNVVGHAAKAERFSEEMQQVTKVFLSSLCDRFFQLEALLWLSGQSVV